MIRSGSANAQGAATAQAPGVHRLNLNPAARPYLARNAPTCSSRSSHSEAHTTPLRTEAAIHAGTAPTQRS